MKKISEKYYLDYYIVFVMLCVLEVVLIIHAIMHPRPQNIALVLIDGFLIFLNSRWMNKAKYTSPYDYDKELKNWEKRKKEAKKQGEIFEEPRPERPKKIGIKLFPMFLVTLFLGYCIYFQCSILNIMFSSHMPYEYRGDIAELKNRNYNGYYFFPDELPEDAENIKWNIVPSFLQGSGMEVLVFDAPDNYIQNVIDTYGKDAEVCGLEDDMSFMTLYDDTRWEELTVYKIYDNDDWNHVRMWGFFVDEEIGRIGFFNL